MSTIALNPEEQAVIGDLVGHYHAHQDLIRIFLNNIDDLIVGSAKLTEVIHSVKKRLKDEDTLKGKLARQLDRDRRNGVAFHINKANLFTEINDLAGYRVLHLHTTQMKRIHETLLSLFEENRNELIEPPKANIWDEESKKYFEGIGIETVVNPRMYASVHYVVASTTKTRFTCEIQVRTLSDEVWGEVDHRINYPQPVESVACREQIRVLARVASSASRLVDSIFESFADFRKTNSRVGNGTTRD